MKFINVQLITSRTTFFSHYEFLGFHDTSFFFSSIYLIALVATNYLMNITCCARASTVLDDSSRSNSIKTVRAEYVTSTTFQALILTLQIFRRYENEICNFASPRRNRYNSR